MRAGIAGLGYWGRNILRNLYELNVLHAACDINPEAVKNAKESFKANYTCSFRELVTDPEIEAIIISTPAETHYGLAKEALNAGKDVFVEKPLALSAQQGKELADLAKDKHRILMVGHILQHHPAVIKLKELVKGGVFGKIQYVYSNRLNIGKLRVEENILWSFAPHDISVILMLIEDEPLRVSCSGESYLNEGIYDVTLTTLEFKNRIKAHIFVSWLHPFKEQKLVVVGSKAMVVFDDLSKEKLFIYPHKIEWEGGKIPVAQKAGYYCVEVESKEPLREEMKHFIDCVRKRETPKAGTADEGLRVLRVLEAADRSLQGNKMKAGQTNLGSKEPPPGRGYFIHPSSCIDDNVEIGEGVRIWHFSHILQNSKIGRDSIVGQNVMIGPDVKIGQKCKIQNNVSIYKGVTLEDEVFCGPSCVFTNVYNPRAAIERKDAFLQTLVKQGATVGANATIVCGVTVGKYAFIGAGSVVKKDISDYAMVAGVPARQIGWACKCAATLVFGKDNYARCNYCGSVYRLLGDKIEIEK